MRMAELWVVEIVEYGFGNVQNVSIEISGDRLLSPNFHEIQLETFLADRIDQF